MAAISTAFNVFNTNATDPKVAALSATTIGDLIVVVAAYTGMTSPPVITDDQTGGTYTEVTAGALKATSADAAWIFVRNALAAATVTHNLSAARAGTTGGGMSIYRVSGMSRAGSSAIRQFAKQQNQAGSAAPAPVFGSAVLTGNPTLGAVHNGTNPATLTEPTGWTERADIGYATPTTGLEVVIRDSGFTGTTVTWGSATTNFSSLVIELDTSAAPTNGPPRRLFVMQAVNRASSY